MLFVSDWDKYELQIGKSESEINPSKNNIKFCMSMRILQVMTDLCLHDWLMSSCSVPWLLWFCSTLAFFRLECRNTLHCQNQTKLLHVVRLCIHHLKSLEIDAFWDWRMVSYRITIEIFQFNIWCQMCFNCDDYVKWLLWLCCFSSAEEVTTCE